jgi:hypothetical protein
MTYSPAKVPQKKEPYGQCCGEYIAGSRCPACPDRPEGRGVPKKDPRPTWAETISRDLANSFRL